MTRFRSLVPDSKLVQEVIRLVRSSGGKASATDVVQAVLEVPGMDPPLAAALVNDLVSEDWRVRVDEETCCVELTCEDDDCRPIDETDYVVFDLETTGSKTPPCRVIEIGAYRVSRGSIVAEFETLVNPLTPIPPFISNLTGISDAMVATAPLFEEVASAWLDFAGTAVLVAHNAPFDVRFVNHEISLLFPGKRMFNPTLCTVSLARRLIPEAENHRLHNLARHLNVPLRNRHRAGGDARATAQVFLHLLDVLRENGVRSLAEARCYRGNKSQSKA